MRHGQTRPKRRLLPPQRRLKPPPPRSNMLHQRAARLTRRRTRRPAETMEAKPTSDSCQIQGCSCGGPKAQRAGNAAGKKRVGR